MITRLYLRLVFIATKHKTRAFISIHSNDKKNRKYQFMYTFTVWYALLKSDSMELLYIHLSYVVQTWEWVVHLMRSSGLGHPLYSSYLCVGFHGFHVVSSCGPFSICICLWLLYPGTLNGIKLKCLKWQIREMIL